MFDWPVSFGCSLPMGVFDGRETVLCGAFGSAEALLACCAQLVDSVELRAVSHRTAPAAVTQAVRMLKAHGLTATIHGELSEPEDFFAPYEELLTARLQAAYCITVHPLPDAAETERVLRGICAKIVERGYPLKIALENQRLREGVKDGLCADVSGIAARIGLPCLGTCFDFGHQLSNERKFAADEIPPQFLALARHTHIHSLYEGRTHFPLTCGETALDRNLTALYQQGYNGVLNLELSAERYADQLDVKDTLVQSVGVLKLAAAHVAARAKARSFYREDYCAAMTALKAEFDAGERCVALPTHAGYILRLGDLRIAVDVAPGYFGVPEAAKAFLRDWISECDAVVTTHQHGDHYDRAFQASLPETVVKIVPDFIPFDVPGTVRASDGSEIRIKDALLRFYASGHSLGKIIVPEYGFMLTHRGETYVFPGDVRDYACPVPVPESVRVLFAHVWFGRGNALNLHDRRYAEEFCRFVKQFGAQQVCLAHLYEAQRTIDEMWSEAHTDSIRDDLPGAKVLVAGECFAW